MMSHELINTDASSRPLIIDQIKQLLSQHYKELSVFGSSCKAYRRFLSKFKGCPFQLYSLHINLRWNETMKTWSNKLKEHESYGFVLNESMSFLRSIPDHTFLRHLHHLKQFLSNMQEKFRHALDSAFRNYRKLHQWIAEFQCKLKSMTKCQRTRIRKNSFDQDQAAECLIQLKHQIDDDIRKFVARFGGHTIVEYTPLPIKVTFKETKFVDNTHLNRLEDPSSKKEHKKSCVRVEAEKTCSSEKRVKIKQTSLPSTSQTTNKSNSDHPSEFVRRSEFHEMPDKQLEKDLHDTTPYVLFSIPSSSIDTDERFRSHNANMTRRKKLEKLDKFDFGDVISMRHYKNLVHDVHDGDDILNELKYQQEKRFQHNMQVRDHLNINGFCSE
ncbi:hypothetical protein FDP41_000242 [Naegleria fowleri]|uniref:Uncharacterized protein n=1 Tax=Naegleria fowleri TaxID=5763 RepID=A0A6A5C462_NAEFO|nr:uncharacterized protein FDP41_000242 [Naegleria fowleri]KAF0985203.1 hypothetical protein FDP41_000242 [Naegleria fowleri]